MKYLVRTISRTTLTTQIINIPLGLYIDLIFLELAWAKYSPYSLGYYIRTKVGNMKKKAKYSPYRLGRYIVLIYKPSCRTFIRTIYRPNPYKEKNPLLQKLNGRKPKVFNNNVSERNISHAKCISLTEGEYHRRFSRG